jgi:hypothetical protein
MLEELYLIKESGQPQNILLHVSPTASQRIPLTIDDSSYFAIDDYIVIKNTYPSLSVQYHRDDVITEVAEIVTSEIKIDSWDSSAATVIKQIISSFQGGIAAQDSERHWNFYAYSSTNGIDKIDKTQELKEKYFSKYLLEQQKKKKKE